MFVLAYLDYKKKRQAKRERAAAAAEESGGVGGNHDGGEEETVVEPGPSRPQIIVRGSRSSNVSFSGGVRSRNRSNGGSPEEKEALTVPTAIQSPPLSPSDSLAPTPIIPQGDRTGSKGLPHTLSTNTTTSTAKSSRMVGVADLRHGSHKKRLAHIPFIRRPVSAEEMEEEEGAWVKEEHQAVEWLSLFYVVVAVLTVFSAAHELQTPEAIPIFFSYFVLLSWCWTSQTYYDVRYQCEDIYHRACKACQIACFVYMGAASGRWNPGSIGDSSGLDGFDFEATDDANHSFTTVVLAFIGLRVILGVQYAVCMVLAHHVKRPEKRGLIAQVGTLAISTIFAIVAVALPNAQAGAKIGLFYASMGAEMLMVWINTFFAFHVKLDPGKIAERYAAFTLIILGEGFIGLTKSFNNAISGLSTNYANVYAQVFLIIMVIFCNYLFLFSRFNSEDEISEQRVFLWQIVHFPLHFALLLLLAGMVNVITNISYDEGLGVIVNQFNVTVNALGSGENLNSTYLRSIGANLDKLSLYPDWNTELETLQAIADMPQAERFQDPTLLSLQYFGQIIVQVSSSYGVDLADNTREALNKLYAFNVTSTTNTTALNERIGEAVDIFLDIGSSESSASLSGVLWLFPCAGATLIFTCLRSLCWYKYAGIAHWLIHGSQVVMGVLLALLGLLDIGHHEVEYTVSEVATPTNPMYYLLQTKWPIAIIGVTYFFTYFGPLYILVVLQMWRGGDVFPSEDTIREEEKKKAERGEPPEQIRREENFVA